MGGCSSRCRRRRRAAATIRARRQADDALATKGDETLASLLSSLSRVCWQGMREQVFQIQHICMCMRHIWCSHLLPLYYGHSGICVDISNHRLPLLCPHRRLVVWWGQIRVNDIEPGRPSTSSSLFRSVASVPPSLLSTPSMPSGHLHVCRASTATNAA